VGALVSYVLQLDCNNIFINVYTTNILVSCVLDYFLAFTTWHIDIVVVMTYHTNIFTSSILVFVIVVCLRYYLCAKVWFNVIGIL
jgi:hypothetical protein